MKTTRGTRIRVGLFVLISLLIGGSLAFVIGTQENVFSSKTNYHAIFDDVGGLQPGSTVRVAGVSVGTVEAVSFIESGGIRVDFEIIDDAARLIRGPSDDEKKKASLAAVGAKGLLGDKLIEISVGHPSLPEWSNENAIPRARATGIMQMAEGALSKVEGTAHNLELATEPFADQEFSYDLKETARNLAKVSGMLANEDGAIQRLMTDSELGDDVAGAVKNLRSAAAEITQVSKGLQNIVKEIESGDGTANAVIYGQEGKEALTNIRDASGQLAQLLKDIREGDGTVSKLVYGDVGDSFFENLDKASADIAYLMNEMRQGRGTVGALMTDPSIYEDIKRLIGDLERNDILRALVRYSIRRDEAQERVDVQEQ